jgi:hypothetical protein
MAGARKKENLEMPGPESENFLDQNISPEPDTLDDDDRLFIKLSKRERKIDLFYFVILLLLFFTGIFHSHLLHKYENIGLIIFWILFPLLLIVALLRESIRKKWDKLLTRAERSARAICPRCGKELEKGATLCNNCGLEIE